MTMLPTYKPEGLSGFRKASKDESLGPPLKRLSNGATLRELQDDYVLFNYAALFLYGGLDHNVVQEWINKNNCEPPVYILQLDEPVIHLGTEPLWNCVLWAVNKQHWPSLSLHVGSLGII